MEIAAKMTTTALATAISLGLAGASHAQLPAAAMGMPTTTASDPDNSA